MDHLTSLDQRIYIHRYKRQTDRRSGRTKKVHNLFLFSTITGSNEGIWEIGSEDILARSKLDKFPTTVMCVTEEYLAAGDEQGGINLFSGGPESWSQVQRIQGNKSTCCTSMLMAQEKGELGKLFSIENDD